MSRPISAGHSSSLREDAYFAEVDQILLENLREAMHLQQEAAACAAGGKCNPQHVDEWHAEQAEWTLGEVVSQR